MTDMSSQVLEASAYCLLFYWTFSLLVRFFTDPKFTNKYPVSTATATDIACKSVSGLFGVTTSACGVYIFNTITHHGNESARFLVDRIFVFGTTYFLYDVYAMYRVYLSKEQEKSWKSGRSDPAGANFLSFAKSNGLITAHHLLIALFFVPLMSRCRDHEPGDTMVAAALVMEASTPFVSLRSVLSDLGMKNTLLYVVNGLVMVVVFFFCRIVVYAAFYAVYSLQREITFGEALRRTPRHCSVFLLVTLLPQLYWFKIMVRGAVKVYKDRYRGRHETVQPVKSE